MFFVPHFGAPARIGLWWGAEVEAYEGNYMLCFSTPYGLAVEAVLPGPPQPVERLQ
jgi:hypothetical protein